jgi:hypothetical protein
MENPHFKKPEHARPEGWKIRGSMEAQALYTKNKTSTKKISGPTTAASRQI